MITESPDQQIKISFDPSPDGFFFAVRPGSGSLLKCDKKIHKKNIRGIFFLDFLYNMVYINRIDKKN